MPRIDIDAFHQALDTGARPICDLLRARIDAVLPEAVAKVWHGHPVWFLDRNPVVGYSRLKACVRLLFWSGQSFATPGLSPEGTFKAAERRFISAEEIGGVPLDAWLAEAREVQWDYANVVKRKGRLERLK